MKIKVILGDICYPKAESIIIPANSKGIMTKGKSAHIIKDGFKVIEKEAKKITEQSKIEVGNCFSTGPGNLRRRGIKKIYHAVIKRLQSDFTSVYIVDKAIDASIKKAILDRMSSVSICGIGIEMGDLDKKTVARITVDKINQYRDKINIKIIDDNEEFINEINNLV